MGSFAAALPLLLPGCPSSDLSCGVRPICQTDFAQILCNVVVFFLQEYERRFEIWVDNLNFIESYNSEDKTHWVSL